jgi:proteasome activator subunit 4
MHDINAHVPIEAGTLAQEAQALADHAEKTLRSILLQGSTRAVKPLLAFLKLKHRVSYEQLSRITQILLAIFQASEGDVGAETRVAGSLAQALQYLNKLEDCPPVGPGRLVIDWRPIYNAILRVSLRGASWSDFAIQGGNLLVGAEAAKSHLKAMSVLARRARNFFSVTAAGEIVSELRPLLCHHEMTFYKAVGLLCLFLPDHGLDSAGGAGQLMLELGEVWQTIPNCVEWHMLWITLFSRMTRHNIRDVLGSLKTLLRPLMTTFLNLLNVPTGKTKPQRFDQLGWPSDCDFLLHGKKDKAKDEFVKKYTRLIVFSIAPDSQTMWYVQETLTYLKPFVHPLQEGAHTKQLDMFLKMITLNYTKRLGMENGKHRCKRPWNSTHSLSQQDTAEFSELMLPLATTAFYSKDFSMSFAACQALKDLASIATDRVLPSLQNIVLNSIQNVMKPHEVQNAISLASVLVRKALSSEDGMDLMGQLMHLSVAGIDTNDPMKTMVTLRFYLALLAEMPLIDPADVPAGASKPSVLYGLNDWSVAVIDRALDLVGNVSDLKKGNPMKGHVQGLLRRFFCVLLQQMSPTLYRSCLDRIARKCLASFYPPGKQFTGYILDACVYANPAQGVAQLVPALCSKIVKSGGELVGSEAEASYFVHLLGHAVSRAGKDLVPHYEEIDKVLEATVLDTRPGIAKEGQKLLRKLLRSALGVRPQDCRSWSGSTLPDFVAACSARSAPAALDITFRIPTQACQQRSRVMIDAWFAKAEALLMKTNASSAEMRAAHGCLTGLVRGGAQLFLAKDMSENVSEVNDDGDDDIETSLQSPFVLEDAAWGEAMRKRFGELLVNLCRTQAIPENPDVESVKALVRLVGFFLSSKGVWTKYEASKSGVAYNKAVQRNWENGPNEAYPREMFVARVHALVGKRMDAGVFDEDAVACQLLDMLGAMCMHEYSPVRKKAQKMLPAALKRFPLASTRIYTAMLARLADPTSSKGTINGVVYSLQKSAALIRICKRWKLTHDLLTGLLASQHFDETKVQVRLAELWNAYVPYAYPLAYGGLAHPSSLLDLPVIACLPSDVVATLKADFLAADKRLVEFRDRDKQIQAAVIATMQGALKEGLKVSGSTVHWRFAVLAAAALSLQVRQEMPADETTAQLILQALNSDVLALRQLCRAVLPVLLLTEKVAAGAGMEVDDDKMKVDEKMLWPEDFDAPLSAAYTGEFTDLTWMGWNGLSRNIPAAGDSVPVCTQAVKFVLSSPGWIEGMVKKTSQDHRLSGDERADTKSGGATMPLASAGIQAACDARWLWPRTAAGSLSGDLSKNFMLTIESVVRSSGLAGVDALWPELEKAVSEADDRELQCTAAEMVGGIVRASHSLAPADQEKLHARLGPLVSSTLASLSPNSVGAWAEMLRYVSANRDPRRLNWLTGVVLGLSDSIGDDSGGGALALVSPPTECLLLSLPFVVLPCCSFCLHCLKLTFAGNDSQTR